MNETEDNVQEDSQASGDVSTEQSETTSEQGKESKATLYKLADGREVAAEDLYKVYKEDLLPEFNRRSQKLSEYEKQATETADRNKRTAEEAVSQNKLLEDVDPTVRDAIVQIVSPVIQEAIGARDKAEEQKRSQETFNTRLDGLETKYPGGNGMPKFNRTAVLRRMQDPANEIYDPEVLYQRLNWDAWMDFQIKAAMKGKSGGTSTERTSTEAPRKPSTGKEPTTWSEASRNATSRL